MNGEKKKNDEGYPYIHIHALYISITATDCPIQYLTTFQARARATAEAAGHIYTMS